EQAGADLMAGQVLLGDLVLAVLAAAVDEGDPAGLGEGPDPAGETSRHPHEVRVVELVVTAAMQGPPPGAEPAGVVAQPEVGVQHDSVHTVVAAPKQSL